MQSVSLVTITSQHHASAAADDDASSHVTSLQLQLMAQRPHTDRSPPTLSTREKSHADMTNTQQSDYCVTLTTDARKPLTVA